MHGNIQRPPTVEQLHLYFRNSANRSARLKIAEGLGVCELKVKVNLNHS